MGEWLGLVGVVGALAGVVWLAARLPWRIEAHRARVPGGSPVSQLELRVARRDGDAPGWRLYCSIVLARGQDRPPQRFCLVNLPPPVYKSQA